MPASTPFYWSVAAVLLILAGVLWLLSDNTALGLILIGVGVVLAGLAVTVRRRGQRDK